LAENKGPHCIYLCIYISDVYTLVRMEKEHHHVGAYAENGDVWQNAQSR